MDLDARISAGIQKRARNLAAEELLIEVMTERVKVIRLNKD
jgi:hypothetical protein